MAGPTTLPFRPALPSGAMRARGRKGRIEGITFKF